MLQFQLHNHYYRIHIAANEPEYRSVWDDKPKPQSDIQIYHCHNDHLGTPNELTTHEGEVIWLADYEAYGNTAKVVWREEKLESVQVAKEHLQPIRFQGQYYDEETGLHYNRFRYFDPDLGMFITRDPIGLLGGSNVFQYAPNPTGWIDPFGLASSAPQLAANMATAGRPLASGQTAHHIVQENRDNPYTRRSREVLSNAGIDYRTDASNGARLWGTGANQKNQPGHPGRNALNYHGGNVHAAHSDQRIMRLLERSEKTGNPENVRKTLESIGRKMEAGRWRTPRDPNGRYVKPKADPC